MSDLISKQKTIDQLLSDNDGIEREDAKAAMVCLEDVLDVIDEMPTEPKTGAEIVPKEESDMYIAGYRDGHDDATKTGAWIKVIDEETPNVVRWHYECDQCGAGRWEKGQRYCQNCGARMLGEDGDEE